MRHNFKIIILALILFLSLNFVFSAELSLRITGEINSYSEDYIAQTASTATQGYDYGYDAEAPSNPNPDNYCILYTLISGKKIVTDTWSSSNHPTRTLIYECSSSPGGGNLILSWNRPGSNYNAYLTYCGNSTDNCESSEINMDDSTSLTRNISGATITYYSLRVETQIQTITNTSTTSGGGGGGGLTSNPFLIVEIPKTISVYETGQIRIPLTIRNNGSGIISNIKLNSSITRDGKQDFGTKLSFSESLIKVLTSGEKKDIELKADIVDSEPAIYEIDINIVSDVPYYNVKKSVFLTFLGKNASGVVKLIVFTEGMVDDNAECHELRYLLDESKVELEKGNVDLAIKKAQEALEKCKDSLESKKAISFKGYDEDLLFYLLIAFAIAIIFGIIFNLYRLFKFRKVFKKNHPGNS